MHANERLLRNLVSAFNEKDTASIFGFMDPNLSWRWLGTEFITNIKPGTYVGIQAVAEALGSVDSGITDYRIDDILAISASDEIGVIWMACSYLDSAGMPKKMEENWVFLFKDNKITEVWDYSRMVFLEKRRNGEVA